ncbi:MULTISPECIES: hypothetical protein [Candidatus Nitrosocaldus]|uniref:hypothetical protein n=1 Tax=Candidatus Nitrosocaldus TaxID=498374 RepID=UPI001E4B98E6|nr:MULTISPECIES: hypothetical protein [Candidatus Nitrosocaldus]
MLDRDMLNATNMLTVSVNDMLNRDMLNTVIFFVFVFVSVFASVFEVLYVHSLYIMNEE